MQDGDDAGARQPRRRAAPCPARAHLTPLTCCCAQFKLQCRLLGIGRWPFRKLKSLATLEAHLVEHRQRLASPDGTVPDALLEWEQRVQCVKARPPAACACARAPPAARALTRAVRASPFPSLLQAAVYADPASTARPGADGALMLAQLESVRQWDVKFHYNDRKKRASGGAAAAGGALQPATPRLVPPAVKSAPHDSRELARLARIPRAAAATGRRKAAAAALEA